MKTKAKKYRKELTISSKTENLALVRDFIQKAADSNDLTEDQKGKIMLSVDEACTNIIKHAYKYSAEGKIKILIIVDSGKFKVTITDDGSHFNSNEVPDPDLIEYHRQKKVGGLGMFLMKKLMDEVVYNTLDNDRNEVVLVKYIT